MKITKSRFPNELDSVEDSTEIKAAWNFHLNVKWYFRRVIENCSESSIAL